MKVVPFKEQTNLIAENQEEYDTLPSHVFENSPEGRIACCWKLTIKERVQLLFTGLIWHEILTFRSPLQPQKLSIEKPVFNTSEKV